MSKSRQNLANSRTRKIPCAPRSLSVIRTPWLIAPSNELTLPALISLLTSFQLLSHCVHGFGTRIPAVGAFFMFPEVYFFNQSWGKCQIALHPAKENEPRAADEVWCRSPPCSCCQEAADRRCSIGA